MLGKTLKNAKKYVNFTFLLMFLLGGAGLALLMSACDSPMGLGKPVDLDSPQLQIEHILLADGTKINIVTQDGKVFVGPGILFGKGATLVGKARDNERVEYIHVEEIGDDARTADGTIPSWTTRVNASMDKDGWQDWSIALEGIRPGERVVKITAVDRPGNIGLDTVQQLTLLVDVNDPIVETINIERKAGYMVDLLPRNILESFDLNQFEYIDYFQNESFTIRANITHDFSLSNVRINFKEPNGTYLFSEGIIPSGGPFYTPFWEFTHDQLREVDPMFAEGRHYLSVVITATATAGHSGSNIKEGDEIENVLYSFCWYPESDVPNISTLEKDVTDPESKAIMVEKGAVIPLTVFDDDNIGEIYAELFTEADWAAVTGEEDTDKIEYIADNLGTFTFGDTPKNLTNRLGSPVNRSVQTMTITQSRGKYKLFVLVRDTRTNVPSPNGTWSKKVFDVTVIEEGVPVISVSDPDENSAAKVENNIFNIKGTVLNLDPVEFIKIAWIPASLNYTVQQQVNLGERVLKSGNLEQGVKVWEFHESELSVEIERIANKDFVRQSFSFPFNVFEDFYYFNVFENEIKTFVIYTQSRGEEPVDVFYTMRLLPYKQPPVINVSPVNFTEFGQDQPITFEITPESPSGLPITDVTLNFVSGGNKPAGLITLTPPSGESKTYTATESHSVIGSYQYVITAKDAMGNVSTTDLVVRLAYPPNLSEITSPHNIDSIFSSRDTVKIQAVFERAVSSVTTSPENLRPRILLSGIRNGTDTNVVRYADYVSGEGSTTLVFEYKPQIGDITDGLLGALMFINPGSIAAQIPQGVNHNDYLPAAIIKPLADKRLKVDGVSPRITNVAVVKETNKANVGAFDFAWHREGEIVTFNVTLSKQVRVLGNPRLLLPFTNAAGVSRYASFQTTTTNDTVMQFTYKVQNGDSFEDSNLMITTANCFAAEHLNVITDKVGGQGNFLVLSNNPVTQTSNVRVDSVKPIAPVLTQIGATVSSRTFLISNVGIESNTGINVGTSLQYTENGVVWKDVKDMTPAVTTLPPNAPGVTFSVSVSTTYSISARQIDRAGNEGVPSDPITFSLLSDTALVNVVCDNPTKVYSEGELINFKLIFNGAVSSNGTGSVTLRGGDGTVNSLITIPLPAVTSDFSIPFSWTVTQNRRMLGANHVQIDSISLAGVRRLTGAETLFTGDANYAANMTSLRNTYNASRADVEVLSIRPTITGGSPVSNAVITTASGSSKITLQFSANVIPEKGFITVRPTATAGGNAGITTANSWYIPPVLTNSEFASIRDVLPSVSDRNALELAGRYVRTTHGIKVDGTNYVPDTDTKYVLSYGTGITDTAANGNTNVLRGLMDSAEFMWQKVEVINTDKVTGLNGAAIDPKIGSSTIEVNLDPLPAGRQWKVEIDENSFRDVASNYFEGWGTAQHAQRWFWSQQTATPVIRVERVTNNRATVGQANTANATLQSNVRYRIDCVTPGAVIQRGEYNASASVPTDTNTNTTANLNLLRGVNGGIARITTGTMPYAGAASPYIANSSDGNQNSAIPDATVTAITSNTTLAIGTAYNTMGADINLGGRDLNLTTSEALYTARKDYIGATATRTGLTASARGYEGAFKTVIVYRDVGTTIRAGRFLRTEATNTRNGAVTIAGFPMAYNDMSGAKSYYVYRNSTDAANRAADHIFITWEIVSEFWHVAMDVSTSAPFSALNAGEDPWQNFSSDWYRHNYRKYGNWGLRVGNN